MDKSQLARELRERQYFLKQVNRQLIDMLSDDQIIDSYLTCSHCGQRQISELQQLKALKEASCTQEFFELCDAYARKTPHRH